MLRAVNKIGATASCIAALVSAQASNWDQDHTQALAEAIVTSINTGGETKIPGLTYYARGQIRIMTGTAGADPTKAYLQSVTEDAYTIVVPPLFEYGLAHLNDVRIVGTSQAEGTNGTRIVHGVLVQGAEIFSFDQLPNDDPWKNKFQTVNGYDVHWVQFPSDQVVWRYKPWTDLFGDIAAHEALFPTTSIANFPTATYNGVPLKFAEAFRGANAYDSEYRW